MSSIETYGDVPDYVVRSVGRAAEGCTFKPGTRANGAPVAMWMVLPIKYERKVTAVRQVVDYGIVAHRGALGSWAESMDKTPAVSTHVSTRMEAGEPVQGCIAHAFVPPPSLTGPLDVEFQFIVTALGAALDFRFPPQATAEIQERLKEAVGECPVMPGLGEQGLPAPGVAIIQIRYRPPFADELERHPNPPLQRPVRLADQACLAGELQAVTLTRVLALVKVSETGTPGDVKFEPADLSGPVQSSVVEALKRCAWEPALGLDGKPVAALTTITLDSR
jgi:hypothetical protein